MLSFGSVHFSALTLMLSTGSVQFNAPIPTTINLRLLCTAEPCIAAGCDICLLVYARDELPRRPDQPLPRLRVLGLSGTLAAHGLGVTAAASAAAQQD